MDGLSDSPSFAIVHADWPGETTVRVIAGGGRSRSGHSCWQPTQFVVLSRTASTMPQREADRVAEQRTRRRIRIAVVSAAAVVLLTQIGRDVFALLQRTNHELATERLRNISLADSVSQYQVALDARIRRNVVLRPRAEERPRLPIAGTVSSQFTRRRLHPMLRVWRPHRGIDIPAPTGTPVRAVVPGRVLEVGRSWSSGLMVEVDHGNGLRTRYAHLHRTSVRPGQTLATGAVLGQVGSTGLSTAPHLHYELLQRGSHIDPLAFSLTVVETVPWSLHRVASDSGVRGAAAALVTPPTVSRRDRASFARSAGRGEAPAKPPKASRIAIPRASSPSGENDD